MLLRSHDVLIQKQTKRNAYVLLMTPKVTQLAVEHNPRTAPIVSAVGSSLISTDSKRARRQQRWDVVVDSAARFSSSSA